VVFVTSTENLPGLEAVVNAVEESPEWKDRVVAIVQNINSDPGNVLLGEANRFLRKHKELSENMGPYRVPVGPLSFLQVNSLQAAYLYKRVRELIGKGPFNTGLDLYSGVGLIAMHLAPNTKKVLAVEEVGPAALESITAARRNRINNILELCGDALEGIQTFNSEWGAPDWVVLNPPRKGCDEAVLNLIAAKAPKKLVYVSCNPATLARDIKTLMNLHPTFSLKAVEPVDMFPQTEHVECLVLLENRNYKRSIKGALVKSRMPKSLAGGGKSLH
jgi:23S rRNA (uracil1939-C5)-methyltransferase